MRLRPTKQKNGQKKESSGKQIINGIQNHEKVFNLREKRIQTCQNIFSLIKLAKIQKSDNIFCWWGYGKQTSHTVLVSSVQLLSHVQLFETPWTAARQASLSITNSQSSLKLMSVESVMPYNHLILCCPLLLLPSIFPSIRVFSNELVLPIR